jgi:hypothetical protein
VLESVKTSGQFIHVGGKFSADSLDSNLTEIDLSVQRSSFVLIAHRVVPADDEADRPMRVRG